MLIKEIKEPLNKYKNIEYGLKTHHGKDSNSPKLIYRFNIISIKFTATFL